MDRDEIKARIREHIVEICTLLAVAREGIPAQSVELVIKIKAGGRYSESTTQIQFTPEADLVRRLTDEVTAEREN